MQILISVWRFLIFWKIVQLYRLLLIIHYQIHGRGAALCIVPIRHF